MHQEHAKKLQVAIRSMIKNRSLAAFGSRWLLPFVVIGLVLASYPILWRNILLHGGEQSSTFTHTFGRLRMINRLIKTIKKKQ